MKTLDITAATFFVITFLLVLVCSLGSYGWEGWMLAFILAFVVTMPLYLMGLGLRWFVRGLVK